VGKARVYPRGALSYDQVFLARANTIKRILIVTDGETEKLERLSLKVLPG